MEITVSLCSFVEMFVLDNSNVTHTILSLRSQTAQRNCHQAEFKPIIIEDT
jgi:hypothetical protein